MIEEKTPGRSDRYKIYSYHADHTRKLNLCNLAKFLQETAYVNAEELGIGYSHFQKLNYAWVLYRQVIKMEEWPNWDDEIIVKTWPSAAEKLMFYREFELYNSREEIIGRVSTSWIVIDLKTRRPVRSTKFYNLPSLDWKFVNFPELINNKLKDDGAVQNIRSYYPKLQDIDMNNHVNNTRYIDWAFDHYKPEFITEHKLLSAELQFQQEAVFGNEVELVAIERDELMHDHIIRRDGKMLVYIRLEWEKK